MPLTRECQNVTCKFGLRGGPKTFLIEGVGQGKRRYCCKECQQLQFNRNRQKNGQGRGVPNYRGVDKLKGQRPKMQLYSHKRMCQLTTPQTLKAIEQRLREIYESNRN